MLNSLLPTTSPAATSAASLQKAAQTANQLTETPKRDEVREKFDQFVGESFYGMMLKSMRKSVGKTPYFDGGRGEEIFTGQLDQMLSEKMTEASADEFTGPMYELFALSRRN